MQLKSSQIKAPSASPLEQLEQYLQGQIAPSAAEIDQQAAALAEGFAGLGARSLLTLRVAPDVGGQGLTALDYWQAQRLLARYSGSLAFLQTQHQSAASFIANGDNEPLKQAYLSAMAQGQRGVGVGFSHLRRQGAPCLRATAIGSGYVLNGQIPWATGWGFFQDLVVGAALESGRSLLCVIPFQNSGSKALGKGRLTCSSPMPLAALGVTQTVEIQIQNWWIAPERVVDLKPADWLAQSDRRNVLKATSFLIGCSEAALDVLEQNGSLPESAETAWTQLATAVQHCQQRILQALAAEAESMPYPEKLALRAEAIALCHRCAQAAVIASGGAANLLSHPAQRIYREALVFGVSGQTQDLKAASLACEQF